ncbi:MAG: PHP domain-containing protein [Elusimicrobiota bacterium]|jgi:hypothetical protein
MASRIDLHTHTTASDGTWEPVQLFDKAAEIGVQVLSITDHDTTAGFQAVLPLQDHYPLVRLIPGIELNAEGDLACHVLGYFIDPSSPGLQNRLWTYRQFREERMKAMVAKLGCLGIPVEFERVLALAKGGVIGRPHLAAALMEKKVVRSWKEAFQRFLKKDGPAYVPAEFPTASEVIETIRQAKGIPVLAHPSHDAGGISLQRLVDQGLMGIEAYYPEHGRALTQRYLDLAKTYHLVVTGGSDCHGPRSHRSALACVEVPLDVLSGLEDVRGRV